MQNQNDGVIIVDGNVKEITIVFIRKSIGKVGIKELCTPEEIMDISIHLGTKKYKTDHCETYFRIHRRGYDFSWLFSLC